MENQEKTTNALTILSKIVSGIMNPFIMPFIGFIVLFLFTHLQMMPPAYKLIVLGIVFCFTIMMPVVTIFLFQRINSLTSEQLGQRKQRFFTYILTIISYVFCLFMMHRLSIPWYMVGIIVTAILILSIFLIANLKWRLSEHMGAMGAIIGGLISFSVLFGYNPVWWLCVLIILAGVLGSARIISGKHTFGEVTFGFCIGLGCAFLVMNPLTNHLFRFLL